MCIAQLFALKRPYTFVVMALLIVASGLNGHERLVVNPSDDLTSGENVKVREAEPKLAQH